LTRIYFSTDSQYDSGDIALGDIPVAALGVNQSASGSITAAIPANTPTGSYYLIARVDADHVVAELNEENNTYSRMVMIE
jgi:subtilase family serine protease